MTDGLAMIPETGRELDAWRRPVQDIRTLHVILTLRCNYRCTFCFQENFHDDLPEEIWRSKLDPVLPGLRQVVLHGGEPTVGRRFVEFCDMVRAANDHARFSLFTNGLRFKDYWSDLMAERGEFVNFSVNAATRPTYERVNGGDHYDAVLGRIRDFRERIAERPGRSQIHLSLVVTAENVFEMPAFIDLAAGLGADRVRFFFDMEKLPADQAAVRAVLDDARAVAQAHPDLRVWGMEIFEGRFFGRPVAPEHLESHNCRRTFDNLYVGVEGDVSFCNFLNHSPIGNLVQDDLETIWNSPKALRQRRAQDLGEWTYCQSAYCGPVWLSEKADTVQQTGSQPVVVSVDSLVGRLRDRG